MNLKTVILACLLQSVVCTAYQSAEAQNNSFRIVGGVAAAPALAPYQCSLQQGTYHLCGCVLISNKWIITAAHCLENLGPESATVLLGTNDLNVGGTRYNCQEFFPHRGYDKPQFANDIGLIRIDGDVEFTNSVHPIEYWLHEVPEKSTLQLTGWGRLSERGEDTHLLQVINLTSITKKLCRQLFDRNAVHIGHICTLNKRGEGSCFGDSGGPLTLNGKLVGIVNFSKGCATGYPNVFAEISYYYYWIRNIIITNE